MRDRAIATAGLANDVEAVKRWAVEADQPRYRREEGKLKQCDSLITLREIEDAAVEGIPQPDLLRIWRNNQSIPVRGVQVDGAGQGETVEYERQASSGDRVRLVEKTEVQVRARGRAGVP